MNTPNEISFKRIKKATILTDDQKKVVGLNCFDESNEKIYTYYDNKGIGHSRTASNIHLFITNAKLLYQCCYYDGNLKTYIKL